ncbi:hypothetical protein HGRIS_004266 [Hohenbuehelia grisea]
MILVHLHRLPHQLEGPPPKTSTFRIKKKKNRPKKKATLDPKAFEELTKSKAKSGGNDDGPKPGSTGHLNDDADLGDDPFSYTDAPTRRRRCWQLKSDRDYTYAKLLTRFYASLHAANPLLLSPSSKRYTIAPPSIRREWN